VGAREKTYGNKIGNLCHLSTAFECLLCTILLTFSDFRQGRLSGFCEENWFLSTVGFGSFEDYPTPAN